MDRVLIEISKETGASIVELKEALNFLPVCAATTVFEAQKAHQSALLDSEEERAAFIKWNELSLLEVANATTVFEAQNAYNRAPPDSEAKKVAFDKWNELSLIEIEAVQNIDQAEEAYGNSPSDSEAEKAALIKWNKLLKEAEESAFNPWNEHSIAEVAKATTVEEAIEAFFGAPPKSEARKLAIRKIYNLFIKTAE